LSSTTWKKKLIFRSNQVKDVLKDKNYKITYIPLKSGKKRNQPEMHLSNQVKGERCKERKRCRITAYTKKLKKPH
jgi:hypothetical protein